MDIRKTMDYETFKTMEGNRKLNNLHIARLAESIKQRDLTHMRPIVVRDDFTIIDGQHRFEALKILKMPIAYIVVNSGFDLRDIQIINQNSKNWSMIDFLESWCILENEHYITLKKFYLKWKLGLNECILLVGTRKSYIHASNGSAFKTGDFRIGSVARGEQLAKMVYDFQPYYEGFRRRSFVFALFKLVQHPKYNHERMVERVAANPSKLVDCTNIESYLNLLVRIHDFRTRMESRIKTY